MSTLSYCLLLWRMFWNSSGRDLQSGWGISGRSKVLQSHSFLASRSLCQQPLLTLCFGFVKLCMQFCNFYMQFCTQEYSKTIGKWLTAAEQLYLVDSNSVLNFMLFWTQNHFPWTSLQSFWAPAILNNFLFPLWVWNSGVKLNLQLHSYFDLKYES